MILEGRRRILDLLNNSFLNLKQLNNKKLTLNCQLHLLLEINFLQLKWRLDQVLLKPYPKIKKTQNFKICRKNNSITLTRKKIYSKQKVMNMTYLITRKNLTVIYLKDLNILNLLISCIIDWLLNYQKIHWPPSPEIRRQMWNRASQLIQSINERKKNFFKCQHKLIKPTKKSLSLKIKKN